MSVFLPFLVRILLRNPCLLFWISRVAPDMVGRGPQRICAATPASAGCAVMDVLGTMSAAVSPVVTVVVVGARKMLWWRRGVGRRGGRLEIWLGRGVSMGHKSGGGRGGVPGGGGCWFCDGGEEEGVSEEGRAREGGPQEGGGGE